MSNLKQTIAIDIDDVLSASAEGFVAFSNQEWGLDLKPEDYREEWAVVWGVSVDEALKRSVAFHVSGAVGQYRPFEHAIPVLQHLSQRYNLVAVTSRREVLKPETDAWIERYFPSLFQEIRYAGIWDKFTAKEVGARLSQTKAEICRELGAEYLIDDQLKHCEGAAEAGIKSLLFGDYRWNRSNKRLHKNLTRVHDWDEVARYFDAEIV